ncbi:MAG: TIM barrel protein, partial [Bacteroidota bacterium]
MRSRRTFLQNCAALAVATGAPPLVAQAVAPRQRINTLCFFTKHLQWLNFEDAATVLRDAGFDGADLTVRPGGHVPPEDASRLLPEAMEALSKKGLKVPMAVTGIKDPSDPQLEDFLSVLADNGVRYYRMAYYGYDRGLSMEANLENFKAQLGQLAEKNAKYGLCGAYQNHAGNRLGASIWDLRETIKGLDPNFMSCQFDIRHATFEGMRSWENDLRGIQSHVRTTVLKDFRWAGSPDDQRGSMNVPLGEGAVDFERYFQHFKALNLKDPISIHAEYPLFSDQEQALPKTQKMDLAIERLGTDMAFAKKHL